VEDFVKKTRCDSLAVAMGTSYRVNKFKVEKEEGIPELHFNILQEIRKRLTNFPIVLYGASSVLKEHVNILNKYWG